MLARSINPAVWHLLGLQFAARRRRIRDRLFQPKRLFLTLLATLLLVAWIANAVMSVMLRESASLDSMRGFIAISLTIYTLWHLIRVACFRPEEPLESTEEVKKILASCPLRETDLVAYHLSGTMLAGLCKAACVSLLLLPDLPRPMLGFVGVTIALASVDLVRIATEILAWGMSRRLYLAYRAVVVAFLSVFCLLAAGTVRRVTLAALAEASEENPFSSLQTFSHELQATSFGDICELCWCWVLSLVAAERYSWAAWGWLGISVGVLLALTSAVFLLYGNMVRSVAARERYEFEQHRKRWETETAHQQQAIAATALRLRVPYSFYGAGGLAWRHLTESRTYLGGLVTALGVPGILSLVPLFAPIVAEGAFLSVAGGLAFYSFLLLPTALRFDFRRDLDRLAMLKALPVKPFSVAVGQVATPILLAWSFQAVVVLVAIVARPVPASLVIGTLLMFGLLDLLIFSVENLIFLWYPHRLQHEGLEVFLRTTLTFTAKGLLFFLGIGGLVLWSGPARKIADLLRGYGVVGADGYTIFFAGIMFFLAVGGMIVLTILAAAFSRFDVATDRPG